ncbi:MAG: MFS transporter [Acidobacteria bacterium]|nr:MFS transporter [Acidobacteriota bacterium]
METGRLNGTSGGSEPLTATKPAGLIHRTFQAFHYRDFRLLWSGAFTSTTGTWMQQVAQSWLVLDITGSAFYLGLVSFLADLPILLFSLVGGVVADRVDRRKLLLGSQYTQMTSAFILTVLVLFDQVRIWHILALAFVSGTGMSFGGPAYQALVPGLVKRKDVSNAIALNSIQFNLARVIGPLLAGMAMAAGGAALCFGLNGLSFLAVIVSLYLIRATFIPEKTQDSVLDGLRKGFTYLKGHGALGQLSALGFVSTFCGIPLLTLLPVFARDIFHLGATGYANMMAVSGAGAIVGALLYAGLGRQRAHGLLALRVQLVFAVLLAAFAFSRNLALSYAALFLAGICLITLFASITSLVQLNVAEEMRGRVMSIFMLAFRGGMPLGSLTLAYIADRFSPSTALATGSAVLAATALGFLSFGRSIKKL